MQDQAFDFMRRPGLRGNRKKKKTIHPSSSVHLGSPSSDLVHR